MLYYIILYYIMLYYIKPYPFFLPLTKLGILMYMCFRRNVFNSIFSIKGEKGSWIFGGVTQKNETNLG